MFMVIHVKNYINGKWVTARSGRTFKRENPAFIDKTVSVSPRSAPEDVNDAVKAAKRAFLKWKNVPAPKRAEILFRAAELLKQNKEKIGDIVADEMGKVKKEAHGDVQEAIDMGYYMAGEGRRLFGETVPSELPDKSIRTVREPIGVFGVITPWNFPVAIPGWKIFPALVCGNTVVFKPSQYTPACAYEFVKMFVEAGLPPGVLNLVTGYGSEIGDALVTHPDVKGITFTGSTVVGKGIARLCAPDLKKVSLEMGGKNATVIMDDADVGLAVEGCVWAAFGTTGQRCTAGSRIIIHKNIYNKFRTGFLSAVKKLKLGYALAEGTDVGPLVNPDAVKKTEKYMRIAVKKDKAKISIGGKRAKGGELSKGYYFQPTVLENVKPGMHVFCEEIFGPVVSLTKADNFEEAIEYANSTGYGLSSSIFTSSINLAEKAARSLQSGLVYINTSTIGAEIQTPFGGIKNTGNGHRDAGGKGGAIDTFSEMKVISVDYSGKIQKAQIDYQGKNAR